MNTPHTSGDSFSAPTISDERLEELVMATDMRGRHEPADYCKRIDADTASALRELQRLRSASAAPVEGVDKWRPISTAPKYTEIAVFREDAGPMLGIYTSPDQFTGEHEWDKVANELGDSFEKEDWFLFCWAGVERAEGNEIPTHWMPWPTRPKAPAAETPTDSTVAASVEVERDAARYRWLRTRINWREMRQGLSEFAPLQRFWTHVDMRDGARPKSEHIDDYIDAALTAKASAVEGR